MTVEDGVYIPFPGMAIRNIKPVSTVNLIESYDESVKGCNRKCACRLWLNCRYYNNIRWKKLKGNEEEHMRIIWDYYNNVFKITYDMPTVNING